MNKCKVEKGFPPKTGTEKLCRRNKRVMKLTVDTKNNK